MCVTDALAVGGCVDFVFPKVLFTCIMAAFFIGLITYYFAKRGLNQ